jgi:hypothetical protein
VGRQITDTHPPLTLSFLNVQSRYGETKGPRYLTLYIDCDPYGSINVVTPYNMTEPSTCRYSLFMRSKAACGISGDAIAAGIAAQQAAVTQPARDFGFTMLGTLCASRGRVLPRVCARARTPFPYPPCICAPPKLAQCCLRCRRSTRAAPFPRLRSSFAAAQRRARVPLHLRAMVAVAPTGQFKSSS